MAVCWKWISIENPNERRLLKARVRGALRRQGMTELFFESAEPTFDELDPANFFARFPAGEYEIEGLTLNGEEIESETMLTASDPCGAGSGRERHAGGFGVRA